MKNIKFLLPLLTLCLSTLTHAKTIYRISQEDLNKVTCKPQILSQYTKGSEKELSQVYKTSGDKLFVRTDALKGDPDGQLRVYKLSNTDKNKLSKKLIQSIELSNNFTVSYSDKTGILFLSSDSGSGGMVEIYDLNATDKKNNAYLGYAYLDEELKSLKVCNE